MKASTAPVTVLVADDHPLVLRGLIDLIASDQELVLLGSCAEGEAALRRIHSLKPDIAVLDINMPVMSGLDVLKKARAALLPTRVVLLTAGISDSDIFDAIECGAEGLVLKSEAAETLLVCLHEVGNGRRWLPSDIVSAAVERETIRRERGRLLLKSLTDREREIVKLATHDRSNKEVARELSIAEGTVKIHLNNIYNKLSVSNRASLLKSVREYLDLL